MKKVCISFALLTIIILTIAAFGIPTGTPEYLRIHIRANSNGEVDQAVKYRVKTAVVDYLTPCIAECDTKQKAMEQGKATNWVSSSASSSPVVFRPRAVP